MSILFEIKDITKRCNEISQLLNTITKQRVAGKIGNREKGSVRINAFQSNSNILSNADYRFSTTIKKIKGSYFEVWIEETTNKYRLDKAYLTIFHDEKEIVALHCDRLIDASDPNYCYKKSPHLHITSDFTQISKAHIALNLSDFEDIDNNIVSFDSCYKKIIKMLGEEIINKF